MKNINLSLEKIKYILGDNIYSYWISIKDINILKQAEKTLKSELQKGILSEYKHKVELHFIQYLLNN